MKVIPRERSGGKKRRSSLAFTFRGLLVPLFIFTIGIRGGRKKKEGKNTFFLAEISIQTHYRPLWR